MFLKTFFFWNYFKKHFPLEVLVSIFTIINIAFTIQKKEKGKKRVVVMLTRWDYIVPSGSRKLLWPFSSSQLPNNYICKDNYLLREGWSFTYHFWLCMSCLIWNLGSTSKIRLLPKLYIFIKPLNVIFSFTY